MAQTTATMTGKPLIESDRVEGTTVYDPQGNNLGSNKRLMTEKISGRVAYAVISFGGFLGMGAEEHPVPWGKLMLGGYRTDITEQQLRSAPNFARDPNSDWSDRNRERQLHDHYRAPYYWDERPTTGLSYFQRPGYGSRGVLESAVQARARITLLLRSYAQRVRRA